MRVVLAGGGTGGHVFPAIAVAQTLQVHHQNVALGFAGSQRGLDGDLVPRAGFTLEDVVSQPLLSAGLLRPLTALMTSLPGAVRFLRRYHPDAVVGTGGYASAVTVFAAAMLQVPTLLLDFNAIPGRTNRALAPLVDRIGVAFTKAMELLPNGKCVLTGNPLRREILEADREQCRAQLALTCEQRLLLIYGGSQGARRINEAAVGAIANLLDSDSNLQVIQVTGKHDFTAANIAREQMSAPLAARYHPLEFAHKMHELIAAADLALCRAGGGLFELAARGVPMILVPLPHARDDHQLHNARIVEAAGAARVVLNHDLTPATLAAAVQQLLADSAGLQQMAECSRAFGIPDASERVCNVIEELAVGRRRVR